MTFFYQSNLGHAWSGAAAPTGPVSQLTLLHAGSFFVVAFLRSILRA